MTTLGQTLANRENAQKSTGPNTEEGKAASARNSLKHGLTALGVVVKGEDAAAYAAFQAAYLEELDPQTVGQLELAERLVAAVWKVRRGEAIETVLWNSGGGTLEDMAVMLGTHAKELELIMRYGRLNEGKLRAAREEYRKLQAEHRRAEAEKVREEERKKQAEAAARRVREEDAHTDGLAVMEADYRRSLAQEAARKAGRTEEEMVKEGDVAWQRAYAAEIARARKVLGRNVGGLMEEKWYVEDAKRAEGKG